MNNEEEKILNNLLKEGLFNLENKKNKLAIKKFEQILVYRPNNPQILNLTCIAHHQLGNLEKALYYINKTISYNATEAGFYINLGNIYKDLKKYSKSKKAYVKALEINDELVDAIYNIGVLNTAQHEYFEAINYYSRVIKIDPKYKYAYDNLGSAYLEIGKFKNAIDCYNKAINIDPNFIQAHYNLSFALFFINSHFNAWEKYEYRLKKENYKKNEPFLSFSYWNGNSLKNKSLLIYCEQGIGDNVQFLRYIKKINKDNTNIILFCNSELLSLFKKISEIDLIITSLNKIPKIDYYISVMSLPYIFRKNKNLPKPYNFFESNKKLNNYWKKKINFQKNIKVGFMWQGDNIHNLMDHKRSISLVKLNPILELQKFTFVSLQKDFGREQILSNKFKDKILDFFYNIDKNPFEDTIAIIENLDIVITVDTVIAHISATLGKETWIILTYVPDFRWGFSGTKTPWYNNVKLFRQKKLNDWDQVVINVKNALIKKLI